MEGPSGEERGSRIGRVWDGRGTARDRSGDVTGLEGTGRRGEGEPHMGERAQWEVNDESGWFYLKISHKCHVDIGYGIKMILCDNLC